MDSEKKYNTPYGEKVAQWSLKPRVQFRLLMGRQVNIFIINAVVALMVKAADL